MADRQQKLQVKDDFLRGALNGENFLVFDGALGTMIQQAGIDQVCEPPDLLNFERPDEIERIAREYVTAGADVIVTNTFSANRLKLEGKATVESVYAAAADICRRAGARYVGADIGPTGALLEPLGTCTFEDAYDIFAEQVRAAVAARCDIIVIETMADLLEAKAAVLAAKENCNLPVFCTMTFGEDGRTFLGTTPAVAAATLSALGVDAVGVNCSLGPDKLLDVVREMAPFARCPLMVQPNAGLPRMVDGRTVFDVHPAEFGQAMRQIAAAGATVLGGCCGTSPDFIFEVRTLCDELGAPSQPPAGAVQNAEGVTSGPFVITSAQEAVVFEPGQAKVAVIGERINPTGKKKLQAALREGNFDYLIGEAVAQSDAGAEILDVNVGLPGIDEPAVLKRAVKEISAVVPRPLQIDSSDPAAIEAAARVYAGKPLINSVNGKASNMAAILPLVKKYGCAVVGLTLDEDGIPPTAAARFAIAEKIVNTALEQGIPREDIAIDCLVMAAATNQAEIPELLQTVRMVKERLGVRTVLGVSNVSFGMPQRNLVNSVFLAAAFSAGLDMPILNPLSARYRDTVAAFRVLNGQDSGAQNFVQQYSQAVDPYTAPAGALDAAATSQAQPAAAAQHECPIEVPPAFASDRALVEQVCAYVLSGRGAPMTAATEQLLASHASLDIVNGIFVPILDVVGIKYDTGEFFLPQLMASAEAVKVGFDVVRSHMASDTQSTAAPASERKIIVATVEGDIHDIGKNIVKMLLENYGFTVIDLGRDVPPQKIVDAAREQNVGLVGLSALMTTTVKAMEQTIALLHAQLPHVQTFVGGAVLTPEYAAQINATYYAKDAAESARIATKFFEAQENAEGA